MQRMSATQLAQLLLEQTNPESKPFLLDVREPWEFEICNITASHNIPMGQIPAQLNDISDQLTTVVICHHGVRSMQVINYLSQQGFNNLINLDGGIDAWARQIDLDMAVY